MSGPAAHRRISQKGMPPGWLRIAEDKVRHVSDQVRIHRLVYRNSGGGTFYVIFFKDRHDVWCRAAEGQIPAPFTNAIEIAGKYL